MLQHTSVDALFAAEMTDKVERGLSGIRIVIRAGHGARVSESERSGVPSVANGA